MLQWGHGDEAVEELKHTKPLKWTERLLQWGHGDEAVEETADDVEFVRNGELQWGHGDEAVEEG